MMPSLSLPTGEATMETRICLSEAVRRSNLSECAGRLLISDCMTGFSVTVTSLPSAVTSWMTLCHLRPRASPWFQPMIRWAEGLISSILPSREMASTPSSMVLMTMSEVPSAVDSLVRSSEMSPSLLTRG